MAEGVYVEEHAGQSQPKALTPQQEGEQAIVQEVIDCHTFAKSYEDVQRRAETEELEFEGLDMWLAAHREARSEHVDDVTGRKVPARPALSVNLLDQNIQQVVTEARQARLALTVKPKTGLANTKTAGYFKGLVRSIQVESGALEVRLWGLERAIKVGRGGYRIDADYANDGDFDLDLLLDRILDYSTVYWDPYALRADRSDAEWCQIAEWMSERERMRRWPNKPIIPTEGAFDSDDHEWFAASGDDHQQNRRCKVVTHYKVLHTPKILAYHPAVGNLPLDKMPPQYAEAVKAQAPGTRTREVDQRSIVMYVVDGSQVLEEKPWHGRYIPIIEIIGKEYFVKGKRRWKGMIANSMDLLRAINVLISSAVEIAGSMPRIPYLMAMGQDEGVEEMWDDAATKSYTRLYYNPVDVNGQLAPPPQRQQLEPEIQGLMFLLKMMHEMFYAVTGNVAPQMRAVNPYDRSGKAIEALQRQGAAGTSNYLDNLATISMLYEGKVLLSAIPHYYDKPGRVLRVMGEENDDETAIMLKVPFILDHEGTPEPVPCPHCKGEGLIKPPVYKVFVAPVVCPACQGQKVATRDTMPQEWQGQPVEYVDFAEGEYKVIAAIDRGYQTKQEEALAGMEQLSAAAPQLVPMYADLWVRAMGFSGANEIGDRLKAANPATQDDEDLKNLPPAVQARLRAMQFQHQQAMAALGEAQKLLETDAIKTAGQKEVAMIRAAMAEKLEQVKMQGRMLEVRASASADERLELLRGQLQAMQQESEQRHEVLLQLLKEQGDKEIERHSVALHDLAGSRAQERLDASAAQADTRKEQSAARADGRKEGAAARADARKDGLATRADARKETSAERADQRADASAERADARKEAADTRAAEREAAQTDSDQ